MDEPKDTPPLVPAPRHLRRRFFRQEIADELLVPGADPLPLEAHPSHGATPQARNVTARVQAYGRKRAVALLVVIIVSISIPALIFALIVWG